MPIPRKKIRENLKDMMNSFLKIFPGVQLLEMCCINSSKILIFRGGREHHREELEKLLQRYFPHKKEELADGLMEMIDHVLDARITLEGEQISLKKIANSSKKNEMEFDLRTKNVDLVGLSNFQAGEGISIGCNTQHMAKSGLLNGLIDLFFKYKGKYYILDWKSNYLGDHLGLLRTGEIN